MKNIYGVEKWKTPKSQTTNPRKYIVTDPPFAQALFGDVRLSWIWLIVRLYVGYEWLVAGYDKIINPAWVGAQAGTALAEFLNNAISLTTGAHPAVQAWYAAFLKAAILPAADSGVMSSPSVKFW